MTRAYLYCNYDGKLLRYQRQHPLPPGNYIVKPTFADEIANDNGGDHLFGIIKYAVYNDAGGHTGEYIFKRINVIEGLDAGI